MALEVDIHEAQTEILRTLLFNKDASFSELCKQTGFTSDHFNFHIKKLQELELVEKNDSRYALTAKGKEYSNRLDTDDRTIEKQPKTAALTIPVREKDGKTEYLVQKRLKQPFYDYYMFLSGKVRWGQSLKETSQRELQEETGMKAKDHQLIAIAHVTDFEAESGELLEDKIFYIFTAKDLEGEAASEFEGGENEWMTLEQISKLQKSLIEIDQFEEWLNTKQLKLYEYKRFTELKDY